MAALVAIAIAISGKSVGQVAGPDLSSEIIAAGDPTGAGGGWAIVQAAPALWLLHFIPSSGPPGLLLRATTLPQRPDAMAASGSRLVMVFAPIASAAPDGGSVRQVREVRAATRSSAGSASFSLPASLAPLPGDGRLEGVAAEPGVVFVLIRAEQFGNASGERRLLALDESHAWHSQPLPAGLMQEVPAWLTGLDGGVVIAQPNGDRLSVWRPVPSESAPTSWARHELHWPAGARHAIGIGSQLLAIAQPDPSSIALYLLRERVSIPLSSLARRGRMAVAASGQTVNIVWAEESTPTQLECRVVGPGGLTIFEGSMRTRGPVSRRDVEFLALAMLALLGTVLAYVLGGSGKKQGSITLPEGVSLAEPWRRLLAGAFDLGLAVLVAAILARSELGIAMGLSEGSIIASPRAVALIVAFVLVQAVVGEALWGRTVGKALTGIRVISSNSGAVTWRQAILRNLVKTLCPPLALAGLSQPPPGGVASFGTVVVIRSAENDAQPGSSG